MFGKPKRFGFGPFGGSNGIVATPEQEAESARLAAMFGMGGATEDAPPQMQQPSLEGAFGIGGKIMPQQQAAPKGKGLFGKITGAMGDIGSVLDDSPEGMQERRWRMEQEAAQQEAAAAAAAEQRKRSMKREDYVWERQYDINNPKPVNNDTVNDWQFWNGMTPEQQSEYVAYLDKVKPNTIIGPDGIPRVVPRVQGGMTAPPGVTFTPLGDGGPASAPGGFPRR